MDRISPTKEDDIMRRLIALLLLGTLLSLGMGTVALANGDPIGGCPDQFELQDAMHHDDHHGHQHVGTNTDRNADGWLCVKHVSADGNIHVHVDNNVRLP